MEDKETKDIPGQEGVEQQEVVVTEFATPVKFGGIEVKTEADLAKAQEAYKAQAARATKAEQALATARAEADAKAKANTDAGGGKEKKPSEPKLSFLEQQAKIIEFNKNVDTYVDGQLASFGTKAGDKLLVEAFGEEAKRTIRNLVSNSKEGEEVLAQVKMDQVFDAVMTGIIKKGRTPENIEAYNKAINIRNFKDGISTINEVQEVFDYFKNQSGKPNINGKKVDTRGFEGKGESDFNAQLEAINTQVSKGELSPNEGRKAIKRLQKIHVKFK